MASRSQPSLPRTDAPRTSCHRQVRGPERAQRPRGYSMMLVISLLALLAVAIGALVQVVTSSAHVTRDMVQERRAFYAADDMCRIVARVSQAYLASAVEPTRDELIAFVQSAEYGQGPELAGLTPPGFVVRSFEVGDIGAATYGPLPSGPFEGINARQRKLALQVEVEREGGGASARCRQEVVFGTVSAFQFYIFGDVFLDWNPVPVMTASGHAHSNVDFCIGGASGSNRGLYLEKVTSAGRVLHASEPDCRYPYEGYANTFVANKPGPDFSKAGDFVALTPLGDHNCSATGSATPADCPGTKSWADYSLLAWRGQLLDSAHGVTRLRLPISDNPYVQDGRNVAIQDASASPDDYREENNVTSRFVVDPVLAVDPPDVRAQKFADKADIRIINGVWYLRDEDDTQAWPGIPIWSDHPGTHTELNLEGIEGTLAVGQEQLRTARGWGATTPRRYSWYGFRDETDDTLDAMTRLAGDVPPVLSYGSTFRQDHGGGDVYWYPGHWVAERAASYTDIAPLPPAHPLCEAAPTLTDCPSGFCLLDATGASGTSWGTCDGVGAIDQRTALLNGTRSGFKYGWNEIKGPPGGTTWVSDGERTVTQNEEGLARVLPVNLDVAALQAALKDCTPGELGSYFPGTCTDGGGGREFNGILYVTSTWRGALDGLGNTAATSDFAALPPIQGRGLITDPEHDSQPLPARALPPIEGAGQNHALPYPLCTSDPALAGRPYESAHGRFRIPLCDDYDYQAHPTSFLDARPNAVQILNARYVNPKVERKVADGAITLEVGVLPRGLTIATNLQMYVVGDVNLDTNPDELRPTHANYHFVPVLFAADGITLHSSRYEDRFNPWHTLRTVHEASRTTATTTYHCELFVGWNPSSTYGPYTDDGLENIFRFHEPWGSNTLVFRGSQVIGFHSVYDPSGAGGGGGGIGGAPVRDFGYDFHLDIIGNQPPGAPLYEVSGIYNWRAD